MTERSHENEEPLWMDKEKTLVLYAAVQNAFAFAPKIAENADPKNLEGVEKTAAVLKEIGKDMEDNLEEFGVDYREIEPTSSQVPDFAKRIIGQITGG